MATAWAVSARYLERYSLVLMQRVSAYPENSRTAAVTFVAAK
jgi:hypothetical protein